MKKMSFCLMIGAAILAPRVFGADQEIDSTNGIVLAPPNSSLKVSIKTATKYTWKASLEYIKGPHRIQKTKKVPESFVVESQNSKLKMTLPLFSYTVHDNAMKETRVTYTSSFAYENVNYVITQTTVNPYILHLASPLQYKYSEKGKPHTVTDGFAHSIPLDKAACKAAFQNRGGIDEYFESQNMILVQDTTHQRKDIPPYDGPISGHFSQKCLKLIHNGDSPWITHLDLTNFIRVKRQNNPLKKMYFMEFIAVETLGKTYVFFKRYSVPYQSCRFTISTETTDDPLVYDEIHTPTYSMEDVSKDILIPEEAIRIRVQEKPSVTTEKTGTLCAREKACTRYHFHSNSYSPPTYDNYFCNYHQVLTTTPKIAVYPDGHEKYYETTASVYTIWENGLTYNSVTPDLLYETGPDLLYETGQYFSGEEVICFKKPSGENRIVIPQEIARNILPYKKPEDSTSEDSISENEGSEDEGSDF